MNTSAVSRSRFRRHFWLYVIAAVASLGGLLAGFDMGVISGALLFINDTWNMSDFTKGWVVSSAIVGAVIGAAGQPVFCPTSTDAKKSSLPRRSSSPSVQSSAPRRRT